MKKGPLERLKLKTHCQLCGNARRTARLEPAFAPDGEAKTLCQLCRIGSAELLQERAKKAREFVGLVARMKHEQEYGDDPPPFEDWINTLNELITSARELLK